jgi:hypothetical protein
MVAKTQLRHGQRKSQLVPAIQLEIQLSALSQLSKTPSVDLSSKDNSRTSTPESLADNQEPRRSRRIKRLTRDAAS